jgi:DNA-binding transcriptional ArsR family regulator
MGIANHVTKNRYNCTNFGYNCTRNPYNWSQVNSSLLDPIFSNLRRKLLAALLLQPEKQWYMLELANYLSVSRSSLQGELETLLKSEILVSHKDGRRVYYQANKDCQILPELQSILTKTVGVVALVKKALKPLAKKIEIAFIYGSFAQSSELVSSDIDLFVAGNIGLADIAVALRSVQREINRDINPVVISIDEAQRKLLSGDHFLTSVKKANKLFLIGAESDLGKAFSGKQD